MPRTSPEETTPRIQSSSGVSSCSGSSSWTGVSCTVQIASHASVNSDIHRAPARTVRAPATSVTASPRPGLLWSRCTRARDDLSIPVVRRLGRALARIEIDVDETEALSVAVGPLPVVQQGPHRVLLHRHPRIDRIADGRDVLGEVRDPVGIVDAGGTVGLGNEAPFSPMITGGSCGCRACRSIRRSCSALGMIGQSGPNPVTGTPGVGTMSNGIGLSSPAAVSWSGCRS